jgi:predicted ribosomally synthesized peptide with SipW-like signal peptide
MSNDSKYSLSRRKALLGLGTVGVAGAGAGVGTSALFSDTESFEDNTLTAGELNLIVDYGTSVDSTNASAAIDGGQANNGTIDGDVSAEYVLGDVKPGDGGFLAFCPKVVDNPAWLWAGSNGLTDSENGLTEPEGEVDSTGGDPGDGNGELSENIQVTVSYCEYTGGDEDDRGNPENYDTIRELNNPDDYTLADLIKDLRSGFLLDGEPDHDDGDPSGAQAYPASEGDSDQAGPCLCVDWEIPIDVGNEIQSDSVEFDIQFAAAQERNNSDPEDPFVDATVGPSGDFSTIESAVDNADSGDVISVASGTYQTGNTDGVLDVEDLILEGPNAGIAGDSTDRGSEAVIEGPLFIGADNICVDGFEIRDTNANSGGPLPGPGAVQLSVGGAYGDSADGTTLRNNVIVAGTNDNSTNLGFVAEGAVDVTITQNRFTEGGFSATTGAAFASPYEIEFTNNTQDTTNTIPSDTTFTP